MLQLRLPWEEWQPVKSLISVFLAERLHKRHTNSWMTVDTTLRQAVTTVSALIPQTQVSVCSKDKTVQMRTAPLGADTNLRVEKFLTCRLCCSGSLHMLPTPLTTPSS